MLRSIHYNTCSFYKYLQFIVEFSLLSLFVQLDLTVKHNGLFHLLSLQLL